MRIESEWLHNVVSTPRRSEDADGPVTGIAVPDLVAVLRESHARVPEPVVF